MADTEFTTEELASEEWRPVIGCEGKYSVSDLGRVRSDHRTVCCKRGRRRRCGGTIMKGRPMTGYVQVLLYINDKVVGKLAHRLVVASFIGPIPRGMTVNHIDGVKTNNRIANLEVVTYLENSAHAMRMGLAPRGQRMGSAKLTDVQALALFKRRLAGERSKDLAAEFGIARPTVAHLVTGRTWNHVTGLPRLRASKQD